MPVRSSPLDRVNRNGRKAGCATDSEYGSVEPYSLSSLIVGSLIPPLKMDDAMLDNPEKTARLLAALKAAAPFDVELAPSLIEYLQAQNVADADRCTTSSGICHMPVTRAASSAICLARRNRQSACRLPHTCARAALDATCSGRSGLSEAPSEEAQEAGPEVA